MKTFLRKHWPVFTAIGAYWITIIVLVILSTNMNQGHLIYPLDDTYIHMSIAKNAALHQVWGVTKYEFTSSTSSPLWTFLLFISYLVFGVNELAPLIINLLFGTLTIVVSYHFIAKYINSQLRTFIILLAAVFVTPLPSLTFTGMEHVLHALLSICFVYLAIQILSRSTKPLQRHYALLLTLTPLVSTIRYEGLFMVFAVCVLLLLQRKVFYAATLGIAAFLPVIIYGAWSISHGWFFFPNSLLLKADVPKVIMNEILKLSGFSVIKSIKANRQILIFLISSLCLLLIPYLDKDKFRQDLKNASLIFLGTLLLHMEFASAGWFFRYEAYLVLLGLIVISITANDLMPEKLTLKISKKTLLHYALATPLIIIIAGFCGARALKSFGMTPQATNNIYEQHYQMGIFLKLFYQGKTVAVNDIGAVTYLADIKLIDLFGLGNIETAKLMLQKKFKTQHINDLTQQHNVSIAIVYADWFEAMGIGGLPEQWVKAGQWKISNNMIVGSDTVSLFAVDPSAGDELVRNLRQFAKELPTDVEQQGKYTE